MKVLSGRFTERGQAARELDMMARHVTGVAKARHVAAYCKILLDAGTPIILGGWHRDVYDIWLEELAPTTRCSTPARRRRGRRTRSSAPSWRARPTASSCPALGRRPRRPAASLRTVVHGELDWSREVHKQLAGRLRPHARDDPITKSTSSPTAAADPVIAGGAGPQGQPGAGHHRSEARRAGGALDESRIKALAAMITPPPCHPATPPSSRRVVRAPIGAASPLFDFSTGGGDRAMSIIRRKYTANFTTIGNELFDDERLSADEVGILAYLRSRPADWEVRRPALAHRWNMGREAIKRVLVNLIKAGWCRAEKARKPDGTYYTIYEIRDEPGPALTDEEVRRALSLVSSEAAQDQIEGVRTVPEQP
jgi:predicted transcriptional regulator